MQKTGTKRSTKKEATTLEKLTRAHKEHMELEDIIDQLGGALRSAHLRYVAESGRLTPKIEWEIQRFKWYAAKVNDIYTELK